ncbi:MAG: hypothetical protein J6Y21_00015, partial [Clostridia bacterium]|nr:hypothetical protein [Clostridia bacterium]
EPDDDTNFGSHANPRIGSHFGQTKFLVIYPASCVTERRNRCLEHNILTKFLAIHSASPKIKRFKSGRAFTSSIDLLLIYPASLEKIVALIYEMM